MAQRFCTTKDTKGTKKGNSNGRYERNALYREERKGREEEKPQIAQMNACWAFGWKQMPRFAGAVGLCLAVKPFGFAFYTPVEPIQVSTHAHVLHMADPILGPSGVCFSSATGLVKLFLDVPVDHARISLVYRLSVRAAQILVFEQAIERVLIDASREYDNIRLEHLQVSQYILMRGFQ